MQESNNQFTTTQDILKQIVTEFGKQIFDKSASIRLEGLLSDYLTDSKAQLKLFRSAISQNIAHELWQVDTLDKAAKTIKINTLKTRFQSENFLVEAIARDVVDCFAYALGWNIATESDKEVRIDVKQTADVKAPSAKIEKIWVEHNVRSPYEEGMKIHIKFLVNGMLNKQGCCTAWFYDSYTQQQLMSRNMYNDYKTSCGHVSTEQKFRPPYEATTFNDFVLNMPYYALYLSGGYYRLKFFIGIFDDKKNRIATSDYEYFNIEELWRWLRKTKYRIDYK